MMLYIISFTQAGYAMSHKIAEAAGACFEHICVFTKCSGLRDEKEYVSESIEEWAASGMRQKNCLIFVGACGIAVRAIAHSVEDKLTDSPVIVADEQGRFVIPILSGHVGGANEIAGIIAQGIGAEAVITTATDINGMSAVDVFAAKHNLTILNRDGIAKISSRMLAGESITMAFDRKRVIDKAALDSEFAASVKIVDYPPADAVDIIVTPDKAAPQYGALLYLKPRQYVIGIGCKKNTSSDKIEAAVSRSLADSKLSKSDIMKVASIDVKKNEQGILDWCAQNRIKFVTYNADELMSVPGVYSTSEFVREHVGVDNVCERAAVCGCMDVNGSAGKIVYSKHAFDGVTVAAAMLSPALT